MAAVTIYHNPKCSKSRGALEILEQKSPGHEIVEYLKSPPTRETLVRLLELLPDEPGELVRKDSRFKELGLDASDYQSRDAVIGLLIEHPELMQRPVVIAGDRAVIARPSDKVMEIL